MKYEHIILGATGHVGSALASKLIKKGETVLLIGHDPDKAKEWQHKGVDFKIADLLDAERLSQLFSLGARLFILNPPAPPAIDTVAAETKSIDSVLGAVRGQPFKKIVAASTYGAQSGDQIGDLGVLYHMEQELAKLDIPVAVLRSAYYMSNWLAYLPEVKKTRLLPSLYPADFPLPMVATSDIGAFAADLMTGGETGLHFIEGPRRYSPSDVAGALTAVLGINVGVNVIPENQWEAALIKSGFSPPAARYMINMTRLTLENDFEVSDPVNGKTTLIKYFQTIYSHSHEK